jgi:hypothetical protein
VHMHNGVSADQGDILSKALCLARLWPPVRCGAPSDALSASAPVFASGTPDWPSFCVHNPTCNGHCDRAHGDRARDRGTAARR